MHGSVKTRIMYRCNLNSKQIQQYLSFLLEANFLEKREDKNRMVSSYYTTERGTKFIKTYQQLQDVLVEALGSAAKGRTYTDHRY